MPHLIAWLHPQDAGIEAAFVSSAAPQREPVRQLFQTRQEAQAWVLAEARAVGAPVQWSRHPR